MLVQFLHYGFAKGLTWKALALLIPGCTCYLLGQVAPVSPNRPWHAVEERQIEADATKSFEPSFSVDPSKTYSLAELIDLAETHNPETRFAWERARAQAAAMGVARSDLYPALAASVLSQTGRDEIFFGPRFNGQVVQRFQAQLDLNYTIFDFGARSGRISAARAELLASNFGFNDTHRNVIFQVEQAYYRLLSAVGQEDAARASLSNAQAVQQAAEDRLANGLATLPDVLEARSATAQADYDLQTVLGDEQIERGDLATAIGASATTAIHTKPLDQVPVPESINETVDQAIDRALERRPDLMQQVAQIRSGNAKVKEAKAAYYPSLSLDVGSAPDALYGYQSPFPWAHTGDLTGSLSLTLRWTAFDGGARNKRLSEAQANVRAAEAQTNVACNRIADEVWVAYSNLNTAFGQRRAALALVTAATQSYNAALESYRYGVRNLLDVTAAQRTLAQARSADVLARTQVLTSLATLAYRTADSIQVNKSKQQP
ncbi:MAG: TolC family protein [Candidatus Sulfotelmatobacter sp.]